MPLFLLFVVSCLHHLLFFSIFSVLFLLFVIYLNCINFYLNILPCLFFLLSFLHLLLFFIAVCYYTCLIFPLSPFPFSRSFIPLESVLPSVFSTMYPFLFVRVPGPAIPFFSPKAPFPCPSVHFSSQCFPQLFPSRLRFMVYPSVFTTSSYHFPQVS